jgi:S1-C subfamily serine protease
MAVPERLVEVWAATADGRGKCGSGWIVGQDGVLSCRHVLDRYLADADEVEGGAGRPTVQIRRAGASSAGAWVDCVIVWQHPARDLALLRIAPRSDQSWDSPLGRSSRLAGTGERPFECVAMGFPDAEAKPAGLRDSEQVTGRLLPAGAARDPGGLVPLDVDSSVPDDAALWEGFSGSAVVDRRARLVGVVVKVHPDRQRRRLLVVPIEDTATDLGFAVAAAAVGLDPIVEDVLAPEWRQSVEPRALTATGVPLAVADAKDLRSSAYMVLRPAQAALPWSTSGGTRTLSWTLR